MKRRRRNRNAGSFVARRRPAEVVPLERLREVELDLFAERQQLEKLTSLLSQAELDRDFWRALRCTP